MNEFVYLFFVKISLILFSIKKLMDSKGKKAADILSLILNEDDLGIANEDELSSDEYEYDPECNIEDVIEEKTFTELTTVCVLSIDSMLLFF